MVPAVPVALVAPVVLQLAVPAVLAVPVVPAVLVVPDQHDLKAPDPQALAPDQCSHLCKIAPVPPDKHPPPTPTAICSVIP